MRYISLFAMFFVGMQLFHSQQNTFPYSIQLKPKTVSGFDGLHSFVFAQDSGKVLLIGGRKDGLHARQPFNAFPENKNNADIYVLDLETNESWVASISNLSTSIREQLQSTNMNFYQDADSLYIIGGYAYSPTAADHITFPYLTSVNVSGLIHAIINQQSIDGFFKQITSDVFAISGGHLAKIGDTFYLVGGHRFDGRYNPMGNPTYVQTYSSSIRKFKISNSGSTLVTSNYSEIVDPVNLHSRDYNLVPQVFPNQELGYTISSGVFQINADLPFLYPVDIKASGYEPVTTFNQYLSNYHSANTALYDLNENKMYSIFFGGMSQYHFLNGQLITDNTVPFVKTISLVTRDSNGLLQEFVFGTEMPALIGSSAEFIPIESVPHYENEVVKMNDLSGDSILIGHIVGGIYSSDKSAFTNNNTAATSAHGTLYEVWLTKDSLNSIISLNGVNPFNAKVFPNPSDSDVKIEFNVPTQGDVEMFISDQNGKIVSNKVFENIKVGQQAIELPKQIKLSAGNYYFNFVFEGKYNSYQKVIILK
jgi:hypothetical protein